MRHLQICFALLLCSALLHADGLADLKAALKRLPAPAMARVRLVEHSTEREEGKDRTEQRTVLLEDGPSGTVLLQDSRSAPEAPSRKGKAKTPGLRSPTEFTEALRPAEGLLKQLETARLLAEQAEVYEGQPARRLQLALELDLDADARSHLKQADHEATVWIGPDGLPLAMRQHIEVKVRVLLFASVWTKVDIQRRFQRYQGRLLLLDEQADVQGSALGNAFSSKESTRCTIEP